MAVEKVKVQEEKNKIEQDVMTNQSAAKPMKNQQFLLTFRKMEVYSALKTESYFDQRTGEMTPPRPVIKFAVNKEWIDLPADGEFWAEFAEYATMVAEALKGVTVTRYASLNDVAYAKQVMEQFRAKGA